MEPLKEIEQLYFELASESRLTILHAINKKSLKMTELAKSLDMTSTETFRQLQRLSEASFISKDVDGTYSLTPFGKIVLFLSPSFEFILKNKQYFLEHDIESLPSEFIFRIGELNNGVLKSNVSEAVKLIEEMITNAEDHIWTMTSQVLAPHGNAVKERCSKGVKFRSLHPKDMFPSEIEYPELDCIERRYLPKTPVITVLTEKKAVICFPFFGGTPDLKAFFGEDPSFMKWTTELYLNYWNQGEVMHKRAKTK